MRPGAAGPARPRRSLFPARRWRGGGSGPGLRAAGAGPAMVAAANPRWGPGHLPALAPSPPRAIGRRSRTSPAFAAFRGLFGAFFSKAGQISELPCRAHLGEVV